MPLCHCPCSCDPNHGLQQNSDWMNEIDQRWVAAHGTIMLTSTYRYHAPSALKQMIDRMVCADGGNPDPTTTGGKDAQKAKRIEQEGWNHPKHLAGRACGVVMHGDAAEVAWLSADNAYPPFDAVLHELSLTAFPSRIQPDATSCRRFPAANSGRQHQPGR